VPPKPIQYEYLWSNGNREVIQLSSSTTNELDASETQKHEVWTVTVRTYDGVGFSFRDSSATASGIANTPPGAPEISAPTVESTSANLVATLSALSPDPDIDGIQYRWKWFKNGALQTSLTQGFSPSISSQVNFTQTAPGDSWHVVVTPTDDEVLGTPASTESAPTLIMEGGIEPSLVSLGISPPEITLGQAITASGQIFPATETGANVTFESLSPSGVPSDTFPPGLAIGDVSYNQSFVPTEASEGRSDWSLAASWAGDGTYTAATSDPVSFAVLKAQPEIGLTLNRDTALLGLKEADDFAAEVQLSVESFPAELAGLLAGLGVRVSVQRPDGTTGAAVGPVETDGNGVAVFTKATFADAGVIFDEAGVWRFKAEFAGDDNFRLASTPDFGATDARLTVKRGAGYAIVVLGRIDAFAEGHPEHATTTDFIYDTLRARGFDADDIYYLRDYLSEWGESNNRGLDTHAATKENLQFAIEEWAKGKMDESPAPLYIAMVDHGSPGRFHIDDGATAEEEFMTADEVATSIALLESSLTPAAAEEDIVVVYGACYSGSFIPNLSGPGRVIVTSTSAELISYRGVNREPSDPTSTRDGEFFLMEFFRELGAGRSIADAFTLASDATIEYTADSTGGGAGISGPPQIPLLDDNGDGVGSSTLSTAGDGVLADLLVLGLGSNDGSDLSWFTASASRNVGETKAALAAPLTAETTGRAVAAGDTAWVEVKSPDYIDGVLAHESYAEFQRVAEIAGPILPTSEVDLGGGKVQYQWSPESLTAADVAFEVPGTYKVYYFLRDGATERTASYLVTNIYVPVDDNVAPEPVELLFPAAGAETNTDTFFAWTTAVDADGDAVTYRLEISEDDTFPEMDSIVIEGIADTRVQTAGLIDLRSYFWRVIPIDQFGASGALGEHDVQTFTTNNTNPALPGAVVGIVRAGDAKSGAPLPGVEIRVKRSAFENVASDFTTTRGEFFIGGLSGDVYSVEAALDGYEPATINSLRIAPGQIEEIELALQVIGGEGEGEGEGDGSGCSAFSPRAGWSAKVAGDAMLILLLVLVLSVRRRRRGSRI
jgi:hypothetical protein